MTRPEAAIAAFRIDYQVICRLTDTGPATAERIRAGLVNRIADMPDDAAADLFGDLPSNSSGLSVLRVLAGSAPAGREQTNPLLRALL